MKSKSGKILSTLACGLLLGAGVAFADNVTVYNKPPSVEELQKSLGVPIGKEQGAKPKFKTRAIVFGDAQPAAEPEPAPAPAPASRPAAAQQPAQAADAPAARPQQNAAPAQKSMQVSENAVAFPINFNVNSSQIRPESLPFLESIAGLLQKDPSYRLLIEGHTDAAGAFNRNMTLSRERAYSVMNYLIDRYGIEPTRLSPVGKGPTEPRNRDPRHPENRRVQFRIIGS
jgi:outer membrane protein OmpA-like peptidoglycan-associated protein